MTTTVKNKIDTFVKELQDTFAKNVKNEIVDKQTVSKEIGGEMFKTAIKFLQSSSRSLIQAVNLDFVLLANSKDKSIRLFYEYVIPEAIPIYLKIWSEEVCSRFDKDFLEHFELLCHVKFQDLMEIVIGTTIYYPYSDIFRAYYLRDPYALSKEHADMVIECVNVARMYDIAITYMDHEITKSIELVLGIAGPNPQIIDIVDIINSSKTGYVILKSLVPYILYVSCGLVEDSNLPINTKPIYLWWRETFKLLIELFPKMYIKLIKNIGMGIDNLVYLTFMCFNDTISPVFELLDSYDDHDDYHREILVKAITNSIKEANGMQELLVDLHNI